MSYAVRNDGAGWRAVDGPQDCDVDEHWEEAQPPTPEPVVLTPREKLEAFLSLNPDVQPLVPQV